MAIFAIYFMAGLLASGMTMDGKTTGEGIFWLVVVHVAVVAFHLIGCWQIRKRGKFLGLDKWLWWLGPPGAYLVGFVGMYSTY